MLWHFIVLRIRRFVLKTLRDGQLELGFTSVYTQLKVQIGQGTAFESAKMDLLTLRLLALASSQSTFFWI